MGRINGALGETGAYKSWNEPTLQNLIDGINATGDPAEIKKLYFDLQKFMQEQPPFIVYRQRAQPNPRKARYHAQDLADWARLYGLVIRWPSVFPLNSVKAMRGALAAEERDRLVPWSRACFEAYWGRDQDLAQDAVLEQIALRVGLDPAWLLARIAKPELKQKLRANTDELVARGVFGSPTLFVNRTDMYVGNDRLPLVEAALARV